MNPFKYTNAITLLYVFLLFSHDVFSQNIWELVKDKEGIKVYTRTEKGSDFKSFKAVMSLPTPSAEVLAVLKNADDYVKWYGFTKTSRLLKEEKEVQHNYVETIFPWPYNNRDMVYKMSIGPTTAKGTRIELLGTPHYLPEKKGIVRMKKAEGYILLKPSGNSTEITYVFHSEPGDNIPVWLANNSIAELPFATLSGLRKVLLEKK